MASHRLPRPAGVRLGRAQYRQGWGGRWYGRTEVATKERGDGSSDLRLDNGRGRSARQAEGVSGPITATHMFSEPCWETPCSFHSSSPAAAAVIACDDERRLPAILGKRLHRLPELAHVRVPLW